MRFKNINRIISLIILIIFLFTNPFSNNVKADYQKPALGTKEKDFLTSSLRPPLSFDKVAAINGVIKRKENPYLTNMRQRLEALRQYVDGRDEKIIDELQKPYDVYQTWEGIDLIDRKGRPYQGKVYMVRVKNNVVLGPAKGGIRYSTGIQLMNEKTGVLKETLSELSRLGTTKEDVEAFIAKWVKEEAEALALGMTLKNASVGLDLGGGKGVVFIGYPAQEDGVWVLKDYDNWNNRYNLAKIARAHSRSLIKARKVGIDIDIPAPDVNTNQWILSLYEDEYLRYLVEDTNEIKDVDSELDKQLRKKLTKGKYDIRKAPLVQIAYDYSIKNEKPVPWLGVYTGKPVGLGGSEGRTEATGFGGVDVMRVLIPDIKGKTVSIQGLGNVGAHVALSLVREGAIVQYINDHTMTLYKEEGFSEQELEKIVKWVGERKNGEFLVHYYNQRNITAEPMGAFDENDMHSGIDERTQAVLGASVDILILAALENQIRGDNVATIKANYVTELANGPTTKEAESELYKEGKIVIPDILANPGGVIVSNFETRQAVSGEWDSAEEVGEGRRGILERAARETQEVTEQLGINSYRIAGDVRAVLRIVGAKKHQATNRLKKIEEADMTRTGS